MFVFDVREVKYDYDVENRRVNKLVESELNILLISGTLS